jgi:hypothetical protein
LTKVYGEETKVTLAQQFMRSYRYGTRYTGHAAIVQSDGKLAEASGHSNRVGVWPIADRIKGNAYLVYRCKDSAERESAAYAAGVIGKLGLEYGALRCLRAIAGSSWGKHAIERAISVRRLIKIHKSGFGRVAAHRFPVKEMMCSEFAVYCYQYSESPKIEKDAEKTAPMALENYLIKSPSFELVGRLQGQGFNLDLSQLRAQVRGGVLSRD